MGSTLILKGCSIRVIAWDCFQTICSFCTSGTLRGGNSVTGQITVDVHLFATLRQDASAPLQRLKLRARTSVSDVVKRLALPQEEIHLVFVNGHVASLDQLLQDGDRLALFPPIGGG